MADDRQERDDETVGNHSHRKMKRAKSSINGGDFISSMPDEILHHIFSFIPIDFAIRTSVLSKRWRQVWCETPSIDIHNFNTTAPGINQTLNSYKALKITSFYHHMRSYTAAQIDSLIEFVMSRNVRKLSLGFTIDYPYSFPDFFYLSSSVTQLRVSFGTWIYIIPKCKVSWKSLRNLSLSSCHLSKESVANIVSGCPNLESLSLSCCVGLPKRLDLSKSLSLTRLVIVIGFLRPGPTKIVAPHIHYLKLIHLMNPSPCTLVDVSSLTQADLECWNFLNADFLKTMRVLAKLHNVERLTVGANFLKIFSLADLHGVPFPTLKVQNLTLKMKFVRFVIPGIVKLLQNSHGLKKLTVDTMGCYNMTDKHLDSYLDTHGLDPDQRWRSKYSVFLYSMSCSCSQDATSKFLASFIKLVLRKAKTLESVVIWLGRDIYFDKVKWFEEHPEMVRKLSHYNNVSIELKRSIY